MEHLEENKREVLRLIAEENYAHARDHEQLRAQLTSTLVAAAFVLIGLVVGNQVHGPASIYASALVMLLGLLNIALVVIHNNRFDMHVSIARTARAQLHDVEIASGVQKRWSLSVAWLIVASFPVFAGIGLLFIN
jgi:hypothetical protein